MTTTNGHGHGHTNGTAQEMREFLLREGDDGGERNTTTNTNTDDEESDRDSDSGRGDENHKPTTTFELVIGSGRGEDGEGAPRILRVDVLAEPAFQNDGKLMETTTLGNDRSIEVGLIAIFTTTLTKKEDNSTTTTLFQTACHGLGQNIVVKIIEDTLQQQQQ